jgi:hypothetical protein
MLKVGNRRYKFDRIPTENCSFTPTSKHKQPTTQKIKNVPFGECRRYLRKSQTKICTFSHSRYLSPPSWLALTPPPVSWPALLWSPMPLPSSTPPLLWPTPSPAITPSWPTQPLSSLRLLPPSFTPLLLSTPSTPHQ